MWKFNDDQSIYDQKQRYWMIYYIEIVSIETTVYKSIQSWRLYTSAFLIFQIRKKRKETITKFTLSGNKPLKLNLHGIQCFAVKTIILST